MTSLRQCGRWVSQRLARQVKLGNVQIAGLSYLEVARAARNHVDGNPGAFEQAGLVRALKFVRCRGVESTAHQRHIGSLRGLGVHDEFAGNGGHDQGAVGGALDSFDRVGGRHADNGGAVAFDRVDRALDGGRVDKGADGVVDENDVLLPRRGQCAKGVGDRVLAHVPPGDDVDAAGKARFCPGQVREQFAQTRLLGFAYGNIDARDAGDGKKGAQRVHKERHATERKELLGSGTGDCGHAGAEPRRGKDHKDSHGNPSIPFEEVRDTAGQVAEETPLPGVAERKGWMGLVGLQVGMFRPGQRVCCAVSGGADSVALLRAMHEANGGKEPLGLILRAVHVHHGLRGAEADADEAFVGALCAELGVELNVERVDTAARQAEAREGVEEAARHLRYGVFWRLLAEGWAEAVATGHTLDDQAETVLMKLLRGAWTEGLGGISPRLEAPGPAHGGGLGSPGEGWGTAYGGVRRPMLGVRRSAVEAYLRGLRQSWCEDSTNGDPGLLRNRVRHEVMPLLRTLNPAVDEALARTATLARDEENYWKAEMVRLLPGLTLPGRPVRGGGRAVSTAVGETVIALELERLKAVLPAVQRRLVRAAAARLGHRLNAEETAKLLALAGLEPMAGLRGRIGARLELRSGLRAERSARELRLAHFGTALPEKM